MTINICEHWQDDLLYYSFPLLDRFSDRLTAVFSSRLGGVSHGGCATLNLGWNRGDNPSHVQENYRRFARAVGCDPERIVLSQQTHTTNLRRATEADAGKGIIHERDYHDIDGLYTTQPNLPLMTHYADCTPLLMYAADKHIAITAHAGWRGTVAGMAKVCAYQLQHMGADPQHIYAVIGPSAGPCCYEIDEHTAEHFRPYADEAGPCITPRKEIPGKYLADLWRTNRSILISAGLPKENIQISGLCTICHHDKLFSHRVQGENRGALAALIMLK